MPASPSLATYSAPEELESGSATKETFEYFDQPIDDDDDDDGDDDDEADDDEAEDMKDEHRQYFREPTDDEIDGGSENDGDAEQEVFSESDDDDEDMPELIRDEDEEQDDDRNDEDARVGNGHVNAQQDPAQAPDPNEEMEANLDDDMEGAMEGVDMFDYLSLFLTFHTAIGLRGPILTVLQNASSMLLSLINADRLFRRLL